MKLYDRWRYLNWAREMGIEKEKWNDLLRLLDDGEHSKVVEFFNAGFKNLSLLGRYLHEYLSLKELLKLKRKFLSYGIPEHEVEDWLCDFVERNWHFGINMDKIQLLGYAYQNITKNKTLLSVLVQFKSKEDLEETLNLLMEYGLTKEEALYELWFLYKTVDDMKLNSFYVRKLLEKAKAEGFKTISVLVGHKINAKLTKKRIDFYRFLGFSQVLAEWWTGNELYHGLLLDKSKIIFWSTKNVNNLEDIYRLFKYLSYSPFWNNQKKYAFLYEKNFSYYWAFTKLNKEEIENWISLGVGYYDFENLNNKIDYQTFKRLLNKSWCDVSFLTVWLKDENYNAEAVESWLDVGVKDYIIASELKQRGFTPEKIKSLLEKFSLEDILKAVDEGKECKDLLQPIFESRLAKRFKR